MRRICAVLAAMVGLLVSAGYAAAEPSGGTAGQAAGQTAGSGAAAAALSGASQIKPTNSNISVRVLSPGDNGDVKQSNTVDSSSTAANANVVDQSADQTQGDSCGCAGGTQAAGQEAKNDQAATALSHATQKGASNTNIPVRVLSPGDDGHVSQSNSVDSDATAANLNGTKQDADQDGGGGGTQAVGQEARNDQAADAISSAEQVGAKNTNISVRVLSPGDDGHVSQSNSVDSDATAANLNGTKQDADQDGGGGGTQAVGQEAKSNQAAQALSFAEQKGASNTNIPVRVLSPGDNGSVKQSNSVDSDAKAANLNLTSQDAEQDQGGGAKKEAAKKDDCCAGGGTQAVGQESKSEQDAFALSEAAQVGASNKNAPVRVDSPGNEGRVRQSNSVDSDADAVNLNATKQDADQDGGKGDCCHGDGTQAIGQEARNDQSAAAISEAVQCCASNTNTPVSVGSGGKGHGSKAPSAPMVAESKARGGSVQQSNSVDSDAKAANLNGTKQDADQDGGSGTQAIGQEAKSEQSAFGLSEAAQSGASNKSTPTAVDSKVGGGGVKQSNSVDSDAEALNLNGLKQDADQDEGGRGKECGCDSGIQAIGQEAKNSQDATAVSKAAQCCASNANTPTAVDSKVGGGSVKQSNSVDSDAKAANLNLTSQDADQSAGGGHGHGTDMKDGCCSGGGHDKEKQDACCGGGGIQAIGQEAKSDQGAIAHSEALQSGASNRNTPTAVDSKVGGGSVKQSNSVDSDAKAANLNGTKQDADQDGGSGTQAIGQEAKNDQTAVGKSVAVQFGASNRNTPTAVDSKVGGGRVSQSNSVDSDAEALNLNGLKQDADQDQGGHGKGCGCDSGTQAIGQKGKSEQGALAGSLAVQAFGHDECGCPSGGNSNTPTAVDSKVGGGSVKQSNSVDSDAKAANLNGTKQDADQDGGSGTQAIGQEARNDQTAVGLSAALQFGASNSNTPTAVDSKVGGGSVKQSNSADSDATAANLNGTKQDADQDEGGRDKECGCHGATGIQAIGQEATNDQTAIGLSAALQLGASNSNTPTAVDSKSGGGRVSQSNSVDSDADALNLNGTKQDADQDQGGRGKECGCGDSAEVQAIGQRSKSEQGALAGSLAVQAFGHGKCGCPSGGNSNTPTAVDSKVGGGSVKQSNRADSDAKAANLNGTKQDADQDQGSHRKECGCHGSSHGIQAIGQDAKSRQTAIGKSLALQVGASNRNTPTAVAGKSRGGRVSQSNEVDSDAKALNRNGTKQDADQDQGSSGTQALGQQAFGAQAGFAFSLAAQLGARNSSGGAHP